MSEIKELFQVIFLGVMILVMISCAAVWIIAAVSEWRKS